MGEPTPSIGWRKREDGMIAVWDLPNGAEYAPMLSHDKRKQLELVEDRWGPLCREIGGRHLLPDGWLQAMIWRESNGNPKARNHENTLDNPRDDGIGLMQITSKGLKGNRTDAELFDPRVNIEIGARYISWLASLPGIKGDFPKIAAAYNAGSVQPSRQNRWGMVSTGSHIDEEVCAYNTFLWMRAERFSKAAAEAQAKMFTKEELLGPDFDGPAGLKDDEPPPTDPNT